jgi:predicted AAA+ superfamily ATPase
MIPRNKYLQKILPFMDKPVIKVITGMRRVGKSTFLKMLMAYLYEKDVYENQILYINKESLEFEFIRNHQDLYSFVTSYFSSGNLKRYIFIDEIQEIEGWEKTVNSLLSDRFADLYITGSNANLLSSELATLLSGRYILLSIYPLSFKEYLDFRNKKNNHINQEDEFSGFLKYGGLPGIHELEYTEEVIFQYLNSIFNTILLKDVVSRHKIRNVTLLENITRFIFDNCGSIITSKRISDYLKSQKVKISVETVLNYLKYLQDAFFLYKVNRFDIKGKRYLEIYEKYYMGDIGLRHGFLGYRKDDVSGLLENIVYLELLNRGYKVTIGKLAEKEVDFIAEKAGQKIYFQVCYLLTSIEVEKREFSPLERIDDNYPKIVLSMDKDWGDERKGILRKNIVEFLLEEK